MDIGQGSRRMMRWLRHGSVAGAYDWVLDLDIKSLLRRDRLGVLDASGAAAHGLPMGAALP